MKTPKKLKHKPIVSVNDYDKIDGKYKNNTDAKALSLGKAQYDNNEISLKIWRNVNSKWSRQSEELPLHRNLDLTILLLDVLNNIKDGKYNLDNFKTEINSEEFNKIEEYYNKAENKLEIDSRIESIWNKINELKK
ncbi:DUF6530 family protein [Tenacibaculum insulae]|uniref:DUF6530 family protein n=1 Tax=Tenacibaculum insulae TaxID=2029677 RepID=UPI003AB5244F